MGPILPKKPLPPLTSAELCAMARKDFLCFIILIFPVLHPSTNFVFAPYIELMAELLMSVEGGCERRVVVNLPPRHMKSDIVSILYVAWRLGRDPSAKFICISYGDDLAHEHSASTRSVMMSPAYKQIFPGTVLDKKAVDHIKTTKDGGRYATSFGSDITGFGADEIIIDDPMQPDEAASETAKEKVRSWVQSSVLTRFNDPKKGVLILVMHRLAPDDLSATMEATGAYFVLKLPLIAEETEKFVSTSGKRLLYRKPGEVLNPGRASQEDVARIKAETAPHVFASQYQQRPVAGGSGMLSIGRFKRFDLDKPPLFETIIHSWDVAATLTGNASVCTVWGVRDLPNVLSHVYLLQVVRTKQELPDVRSLIRTFNERDRPSLIVLDSRGLGIGLLQELRKLGWKHLTSATSKSEPTDWPDSESKPASGKIDAFARATLAIDDGRVYLPNDAPWLEKFLFEIASFPNISDKDQADSMSQLIGNLERGLFLARRNAVNYGIQSRVKW